MAHVQCMIVSLRLSILNEFRDCFGPKKAVLGAHNAQFWEGTSQLGAPGPGRHGEFLAQNLDLARAPPRLYDG